MRLRSCVAIVVLAAAHLSVPASAQVAAGAVPQPPIDARADAEPAREIDTLRDLFAALHACVTQPAPESAHAGMEMTMRFALNREGRMFGRPLVTYSSRDVSEGTRELYREAIMQSLQACMPLPLTKGLANAIAGGPIHFHVVDDRSDAPLR